MLFTTLVVSFSFITRTLGIYKPGEDHIGAVVTIGAPAGLSPLD